jgi:hypothetical protein
MTPGPTLPEWIATVEADAPSADPLEQLSAAAATAADLDTTKEDLLGHFVDRCRVAGKSWSEISGALGVTKQAAHRRFSMTDSTGSSRYTPRARIVLERAPDIARSLNHTAVGTEHVLLAILEDQNSLASLVLADLGIARPAVETATLVVSPRGDAPPEGVLPLTPRAVTAVKGSLTIALELGHNYIGTEHLLLALVREPEAVAARILAANDIGADDLRRRVVDRINQIYAAKSSGGSSTSTSSTSVASSATAPPSPSPPAATG